MKFTVIRSRWLRGRSNDHEGLLLDNNGYQCCVGFRCSAAKVPNEWLLDVEIVRDLSPKQRAKLPKWYSIQTKDGMSNKTLIDEIYTTNDAPWYGTDSEREAKLKKLFAKGGDEIVFVD
jgi:hypothetical protein